MDNIFDNEIFDKAKEVFDVACKKTGEVVSAGKQRFDIATMESRLEKAYNALGKAAYKAIEANGTENEELKAAAADITTKITEIEEAKKELAQLKNKRICPKCSAAIEKTSVFCNYCGEKLIYEETQGE